MKHNPVAAVGKLFNNRRFLIAFSIICAVILWLVIDIAENPSRNITFSDLTFKVANQTDDNEKLLKVISEYDDKVSVTINGPGYIVSNVKKEDVSVYIVSYADVNQPGKYVLNLTAKVNEGHCNVVEVNPAQVTVEFDYEDPAEIPIEFDASQFNELLPENCESEMHLKRNSDGTEISKLQVEGPSKLINSLSRVVITPILPSETTAESQTFSNLQFVFYDTADNVVDSSKLIYDTKTHVRAIVFKIADVKLKPAFTNLPLCYKESKQGLPPYIIYRYNELQKSKERISELKLRGPIEEMDDLINNGLYLSPIDFMKVDKSAKSFNVSLNLPSGVKLQEVNIEEVTVDLDLGNLASAEFVVNASNVSFIGLPEGMTASTKDIKVKVTYNRSRNSRVSNKDFNLIIDCTGITSSGTRPITAVTVSPKIYAWANSFDPFEPFVEIK